MRIIKRVLGAVLLLVVLGVLVLAWAMSHDSPCGSAPALAGRTPTMQAITYRCYGAPQVLKLEELPKPVPADNEVLVRVHAAALNPLDWHYMRGTPYFVRLDSGFGRPTNPRLGVDFAGTVESVGRSVTRFKPGDEVFGGKFGAFAQYVAVREDRAVALKPANLSFEQAAAVPIAAITALQAMRDKGHVHAGEKVLINGASGGVGTFAVQIAKSYGADVTGVCSTRNVELVKSIGADRVIDYTREDFTRGTTRYELILDAVGSHPLLDYRRAMTEKGDLVIIGGLSHGNWLGPATTLVDAMILSPFVSQSFHPFLAELTQKDLVILGNLMQGGKVVPLIDRRYKLSELPDAMRYMETGHAHGKVVIDVD